MELPLRGKTAIVTGANQGLGLEIARAYVASGASVVMCARDADLLTRAREDLVRTLAPRQRILGIACDVSDSTSVERLVGRTSDEFGRIDILVNNAGVYGPMGKIEDVDWGAWIRTMEINLYGSIMMCRVVLPMMKRQRSGKIIQLSGGGATASMPNISAYAVSKAAVVRFAGSLAGEVREYNIDVNSIAPGALNTRMLDDVLAAGPDRVGQEFFDRSTKQKQSGGAGLERAAALAVFLASAVSDGITGKLISAVWDKWEDWSEHVDELRNTDAYTLGRITGRDRGLAWGEK